MASQPGSEPGNPTPQRGLHRRQEGQEQPLRAGAVFVGLPDVLHGLIAAYLDTTDLLSLCACNRFLNQTYAERVTSVRLDLASLRCCTLEGGRPEHLPGLLSRLSGLRKLEVYGQRALRGVGAVLCESQVSDTTVLWQLEYLQMRGSSTAIQELLRALSADGGGGGVACVCPGLRHLLIVPRDDEELEGRGSMVGLLADALISREQMGAASLLTLRFKAGDYSPRDSEPLSRLLLTSKSCESLEALVMASYLKGDCLRVMEAYLSSDRAASLRRLCCGWEDDSPDGRSTIPVALAAGRLPLLEEVELSKYRVAADDEAHLVQWAASPSAARLVSLSLDLAAPTLGAMLRAAIESHGLPRLRSLKVGGCEGNDATMLALVDGMEARGALACLECLEVPGTGDEGIRRLAAFVAEGKGCSRTLRKLDIKHSTATDETGAQLGCAIKAGGLTALEELNLNRNKAWGDATMCALVEALESGKGKSLKEVRMVSTGLTSAGYQRTQAIGRGFCEPLILCDSSFMLASSNIGVSASTTSSA